MILDLVRIPSEKLALLNKPAMNEVATPKFGSDDYLILCGGFEDRATAVFDRCSKDALPRLVILIRYEPVVEENRIDFFKASFDALGIPFVELVYDRRAPAGFGRSLQQAVALCRGRVFIDISGMSRLLIVQTIVALARRHSALEGCTVLYTEAKEYPPSEDEFNGQIERQNEDPTSCLLFYTSGVLDVILPPELASFRISGDQTRLVAFPSFDTHLLISLRAELQPSRLTLIEGLPPDPSNAWRLDAIQRANMLGGIVNERIVSSTLWYGETLDVLCKVYSEHSLRDRLILTPTGSKMQTVAVALFRAVVEDVQIAYPSIQAFTAPRKYTHGVKKIYRLELDSFSPLCYSEELP